MNSQRTARNLALSLASLVTSATIAIGVIAAFAASSNRSVSSASGPPLAAYKAGKKTMRSFGSDEELKAYLRKLAEESTRARRDTESQSAAPASPAQNQAGVATDAKAGKDESITNTQHAGVDEGGIVKLHGAHLVVLRRGRLFTVAIGDNSLKPISAVDAFGPDINPRSTWYDEMLVSTDTVVVIGYSYERGGTEVGLFKIDRAGNLA